MQTIFYSLAAFALFIPAAVFAQDEDNNNLVNLPIGETGNFNDYINAVYLMFISIAALIAVVKIIIAGVKYMFSDIVTQKSDAKNDIKGALLGLLVILSAVVVLTIINPDLTTFDPEITRIEERQRPVQTNSNSTQTLRNQESQNFIDLINRVGLENVTTQSCTYFDTNKAIGAIGSVFAPIDGALNAAGCKIWCDALGGSITNKNCSYKKDFDQQELVENIIKETGYCDGAGCETLDCSFFRLDGSCKDWCDNRGGVNVETSFLFTTQQCIVAKIPLEQETVLGCEVDGETVNCRPSNTICELSGGTATNQVGTNGLETLCTPPAAREVFSCIEIPGSIRDGVEMTYNCQTARARCTGDRTATQNDSGQIVCEVN